MLSFLVVLCVFIDDKISSSDFPCVSGIIYIANKMLNRQKKKNIDQTTSIPNVNTADGYILQEINHKTYPHVCTNPHMTPMKKTKKTKQNINQLLKCSLLQYN